MELFLSSTLQPAEACKTGQTTNSYFFFTEYLDNHPTSPLLAKPPELSEEVKLPPSMKFVAANTVGE